MEAKKVEMLGPKPSKEEGKKREKLNKKTNEEKKGGKIGAEKDPEAEQTTGKSIIDLVGRDCDIGANSKKHLDKHLAFTKGKIMTRFPPEPNGYLHIGHAKAIRFNFTVAKENGGLCYLRFDDTNPCKENNEFIDHIKKNVKWLGYEPWKVTASSDYFDELHDLAVELIKKDKAYVCHQTPEESSEYRNLKKDSPYRNRSVEENIKLFKMMRQGRFAEKECCLRVKMDMQHDNPNMRDFAAYRIRYVNHPHSGDKWCIYPTYDYTHCIVDSLENITHSLCTLEFEIRRESYFQLLKDCDIYKPIVWEYSRLNISNTVLSKRKIEKLVNTGVVSNWNDPRLLTLEGLRKRGYTPSMINDFCEHLGVARKGNENVVSMKVLEQFARKELDKDAPRTFAVLDPLEIEIVNFADLKDTVVKAPLFPVDKEMTRGSNTYTLTKNIYIEKADFSETDDKKHFGLQPNQMVDLLCGPVLKFVSYDSVANLVKVEAVTTTEKLKGHLHWVSKAHALTATVNNYSALFNHENPASLGDNWSSAINPDSLSVMKNAKIWKNMKNAEIETRYQFQRLAFYILDSSSNPKKNKFVFNRIVELKESKDKK
jgi:glutaminyl-tRNA synthetase